jgi:hypothetical protein
MDVVMRDWTRSLASEAEGPSCIDLAWNEKEQRFIRRSGWLEKPSRFKDPVDAVCDFIVDLIHAYLAAKRDQLCIHCAAVEFDQGLVLFPNTYRSGKSTLAVKLASRGYRIFSDDVLPLDAENDCGVALGILPRLRLPLPGNSDSDFRAFAKAHRGVANSRYLYVDLDRERLAPLGTRSPIVGIVTLEYGEDRPAGIIPAARSQMLKNVILRNFARQGPAMEIFDRLHRLVDQADCYHMNYRTLDQACDLLGETFDGQGKGAASLGAGRG